MNFRNYIFPLLLKFIFFPYGFFSQPGVAFSAPVFEWNEEYLGKSEGVIYFYLKAEGFQVKLLDARVKIVFYNVLKKKNFSITQNFDSFVFPGRPKLWKLPAGKYHIRSIIVKSGRKKISWVSNKKKRKMFLVKTLGVSNLGVWSLIAKGRKARLNLMKIKNTYKVRTKEESSAAAIYEGFSGKLQLVLGGDRLIKKAKKGYARDNEIRARTRAVRTISLRWSLNLLKDQNRAHDVNEILVSSDPYLRKCYMESLERIPELRGKIVYGFIISGGTGRMVRLRPLGGSLKNFDLINCIQDELGKMNFPMQKNVAGKLIFDFNVFY